MNSRFINRDEELGYLNEEYKKPGLKFVIVYGRRRLGKTELLKEFIKDKPHIYFLCDQRGIKKNIERFRGQVEESVGLPPLRLETFEDLFKEIVKNKKDKLIIVIDEFSYLIKSDTSIVSVFQLVVDEILKQRDIFLVLCGSYVSIIETDLLSYKSPLYGRRTGQIKLEKLRITHISKFFPDYDLENVLECYSILDAIPGYLKSFDPKKSIKENIKETFLKKEHWFYIEPEMLVREELSEPANYFNILDAIASGKNKLVDIANKSGIPFKDLPRYIKLLINLGFVSKQHPVTQKKIKSKKTYYTLSDNFFRFWFRFIMPNKSSTEEGNIDLVLEKISKELNSYVGKQFESMAIGMLRELSLRNKLPFRYERIGREWGKERGGALFEIDIVALNEQTKEVLFCECKWSENVNADLLFNELQRKAALVEWNREKRKEYFAIFAKSFKEKIKRDGLLLFDINNMEKLM